MKIKHLFLLLTAGVLLASSAAYLNVPTEVQAARYSNSEAKQVIKFQKAYKDLDTINYDQDTLYLTQPNFASPFNPGVLDSIYINSSMDYLNYYRSLAGLPREINREKDNRDAQIGAAALAAVNAKTSLRAHGLLGYKRPEFISKKNWEIAENATLGNVNFLESDSGSTAGEIVTDLLKDENNIAGSGNTGHRALILSARATRMGIGAAYGKNNGKFYSVENGIFADDILRKPVKNVVTYPSSQVFPYELSTSDTPWSAYFANKRISRTPKVYITDLTAKKKYRATHVRNFGTDYYSDGYSAAISFKPSSSMKLVNTHKYQVKIAGVYTYSFRLFRQESTLKQKSNPPKKNKKVKKSHHKKKSTRKVVKKRKTSHRHHR